MLYLFLVFCLYLAQKDIVAYTFSFSITTLQANIVMFDIIAYFFIYIKNILVSRLLWYYAHNYIKLVNSIIWSEAHPHRYVYYYIHKIELIVPFSRNTSRYFYISIDYLLNITNSPCFAMQSRHREYCCSCSLRKIVYFIHQKVRLLMFNCSVTGF